MTARIPVDSLAALTHLPNVEFIQAARSLRVLNDLATDTIGETVFHGEGIDGSSVVIDIVDTGIDFTHPVFRNPDGSTRIKFLCDQTDAPQPGDQSCPGFGGLSNGGTLWTEADINASMASTTRVRQVDDYGHGR